MTKIRTLSNLQDALDADYAWRVKEVVNFRMLLGSHGVPLASPTLLRAGVPLLYAHWEGFVRSASNTYLQFVASQRLKNRELADCFVVFAVRRHLSNLIHSHKAEIHNSAVNFFLECLSKRAYFGAAHIDTKSNLSSVVFENIALSLGIDLAHYRLRFNLIDESLLRRRNQIAHGEYLDLREADFCTLTNDVLELMEWYKTDVLNAAASGSYRRP